MDKLEERYLKAIVLQLEDISKSLKILSGRLESNPEKDKKKQTYADKYFARSE